ADPGEGARSDLVEDRQHPRLRSDDQPRLAAATGVEDPPGSPLGVDRQQRQRVADRKPRVLLVALALDVDAGRRPGPHQARVYGRDQNTVFTQLVPEALRQSGERVLASTIGQQMWHGDFPSQRGYIDDSPLASVAHVRQYRPDGVERAPKMHVERFAEVLD